MRTARRIEAIPPYLFAEIDRKIAERRAAGVDVISFGIGDPDLPTPDFVVEELARAASDPSTHQYPSYFGLPSFRRAIADFYRRRFGGEPVYIPLTAEDGWFPDFAAVDPSTGPRAKLLWLCYPSNPTGAVATLEQLEGAVRFAAGRDLLLAYDNAYSEITYDGFVAPSVLQVPGATEVALEFGSLSKIFNMTGWRIGWGGGSATPPQ